MNEWRYTNDGKARYFIRNTHHNSRRYGNCDVCGKPCDVVHYMFIERRFTLDMLDWYINPATWQKTFGWSGLRGYYGHRECLEKLVGIGHATLLACDEEQGEAIAKVVANMRPKRSVMPRIYHSTTGKGGWKRT